MPPTIGFTSGSAAFFALREGFCVVVVAANPEPCHGVFVKNAECPVATCDTSNRPDVFRGIDALEAEGWMNGFCSHSFMRLSSTLLGAFAKGPIGVQERGVHRRFHRSLWLNGIVRPSEPMPGTAADFKYPSKISGANQVEQRRCNTPVVVWRLVPPIISFCDLLVVNRFQGFIIFVVQRRIMWPFLSAMDSTFPGALPIRLGRTS